MNNYGYTMPNMPNYYPAPFSRQVQGQSPPPPQMQLIIVHGKGGADAFQMGPNSSVLLLDETAPVVWLKETDGAGFPTLTDYEITKREHPAEPDYNALIDRIAKLEEALHAQSNSPATGTGTAANAGSAGSGE